MPVTRTSGRSCHGEIGKDLLVFASRNLNKAEHYSTSEIKIWQSYWVVKHFRPYLYGRKFKIASDRKPLTWIANIKDPASWFLRWQIKLGKYDYEVVFKKGTLKKA